MTRILHKVCFAQKENLLLKKEDEKICNFNHRFKPFQCFNKTSHQKRWFLKKNRYAIYLSYANLVTYVPILGGEQFQWLCRVVLTFFAQTGSDWFFSFSKYPNLQPKKKIVSIITIFG